MAVRGSVAKPESKPKKIGRRSGIDPELLGAAQRLKGRGAGVGGAREKGDYVDPELFGAAQRIKKQKAKSALDKANTERADRALATTAIDSHTKAVTEEEKKEFQKEHPEFYDNEGTFSGGTLPTGAESPRHSALSAVSEFKGGGLDYGLFKAMTTKTSDLSESQFIKTYNAEKNINDKFEIAVKGNNISTVPVWGTAYHWDDMSPKWRVASVAFDVLDIVLLTRGVPLPRGTLPSKAVLAAKAHENWVIRNLAAYDDALNIPAEKSVKTAAVDAVNKRLKYADALADLEDIKDQGRYPTSKAGMIAREPISEAAYNAKVKAALTKIDDAAAAFETSHKKLVNNLDNSRTMFNEGGELAELGEVSKPAPASEILADTKKFIQGHIDDYPGIAKASDALDDKFTIVRRNVGFYKAEGGPIYGTTIETVNDSVNDVLFGFKDLRNANRNQAQILKGRLADTINELEGDRIINPAEHKALTDRVSSLRKEIISLDSFDAREIQKMRSILAEVVGTFPDDTSNWTRSMTKIATAQDTLKTDLRQTVREMDVIWDKSFGGGRGPGAGRGGGVDAPPKPASVTRPDVDIPKTKPKPLERVQTGTVVSTNAAAVAHFAPESVTAPEITKTPIVVPTDISIKETEKEKFPEYKIAEAPAPEITKTPIVVPTDIPIKETEKEKKDDKIIIPEPIPKITPDTKPEPTEWSREIFDTETETGVMPDIKIKTVEHFMPAQFQELAVKQQAAESRETRTRSRPTTKKEAGRPTGRTTAPRKEGKGFRLPDGSRMPVGVYPRRIQAPMGIVDLSADLDFQTVDYYRRLFASNQKPSEGFRVISTMSRPPRDFVIKQGLMTAKITPRAITFKRSRKL